MVSRRQARLGQFVADIFFQSLQFRHVADSHDILCRTVRKEIIGIGDERIRRPVEDRFLERWLFPFFPIGEYIPHVLRRLRDAQKGRGPFIDMVNSAAFGIEDDAICNVR